MAEKQYSPNPLYGVYELQKKFNVKSIDSYLEICLANGANIKFKDNIEKDDFYICNEKGFNSNYFIKVRSRLPINEHLIVLQSLTNKGMIPLEIIKPELAHQFISVFGFTYQGDLRKKRTMLLWETVNVKLDEFENGMSFIEIGTLFSERNDLDYASHEVKRVISLLGLRDEDEEKRSYSKIFGVI